MRAQLLGRISRYRIYLQQGLNVPDEYGQDLQVFNFNYDYCLEKALELEQNEDEEFIENKSISKISNDLKLNDDDLEGFLKDLQNVKFQGVLDFSGQNITDKTLIRLATLITKIPINGLILKNAQFSYIGGLELGKALGKSQVETLVLTGCNLGYSINSIMENLNNIKNIDFGILGNEQLRYLTKQQHSIRFLAFQEETSFPWDSQTKEAFLKALPKETLSVTMNLENWEHKKFYGQVETKCTENRVAFIKQQNNEFKSKDLNPNDPDYYKSDDFKTNAFKFSVKSYLSNVFESLLDESLYYLEKERQNVLRDEAIYQVTQEMVCIHPSYQSYLKQQWKIYVLQMDQQQCWLIIYYKKQKNDILQLIYKLHFMKYFRQGNSLINLYHLKEPQNDIQIYEDQEPIKMQLDRHVVDHIPIQMNMPIKQLQQVIQQIDCSIKYPTADFEEYQIKPVKLQPKYDESDEYYRNEMKRKKRERQIKIKQLMLFTKSNNTPPPKIDFQMNHTQVINIKFKNIVKREILESETFDVNGNLLKKKDPLRSYSPQVQPLKYKYLGKTEKKKLNIIVPQENLLNQLQAPQKQRNLINTNIKLDESPLNENWVLEKGVTVRFENSRPMTSVKTQQDIAQKYEDDPYQLKRQQTQRIALPLIILPEKKQKKLKEFTIFNPESRRKNKFESQTQE